LESLKFVEVPPQVPFDHNCPRDLRFGQAFGYDVRDVSGRGFGRAVTSPQRFRVWRQELKWAIYLLWQQ
jgi:hypothetical protein